MVGTLPIGWRLEALARAGAYLAEVKMHREGFGIGGNAFASSQSDRRTVAHGGLGLQATIDPRFRVRLEWERFFRTGEPWKAAPADNTRATGRTDVDLWSLGASFSF